MNLNVTATQPGLNLPADLRSPRNVASLRLLSATDALTPASQLLMDRKPQWHQKRRLRRGVNGLGDSFCGPNMAYDDWDGSCNPTGGGYASTGDPTAVFNDISQATKSLIPILVSQTPGAIYQTDASGKVMVYAQPTGSTQNLPVGMMQSGQPYPGAAYANIQTAAGSASLGGSLMPLALAAVALIFLMKK